MMSRRLRAITSGRRHGLIALLGYLALTVAFYAPILLGLRWFPTGDFTDHFLPFSLFQRAEILAGRLPIWNPYTFSGHPFLADIQAAVFYPISNLVLGLTLPWGDALSRLYWLQVEALLQIALAGFFTYLLARDLVHNRAAAFLAGCLFAFSGYLTGYPALQTAVLRTAIWLPLVLWCLRRAFADSTRWRWWVAAAGAYAIAFLGGHPQTFLFLSYCVAGWIAVLFVAGPGNHHEATKTTENTMAAGRISQLPVTATEAKWAQLPKVAAFYGLFLGLSAAQLWPSLEFTSLSVRASVDYAFVSGGFPLKDTWQLFAPGVRSQFSPLFVGMVGLGLAVLAAAAGLVSLFRPRPESAADQPEAALPGGRLPGIARAGAPLLFFVLVAVAALFASYGGNSFLYPLLYRWAPGWSMFRGQERAAYLVAFGLSMAAAYGAAAFFALPHPRRRVAVLAWAAVAAAALIAIGILLGPTLDANGQAAWLRSRIAGGTVLVAMLVLAALPLPRKAVVALVTVTILFELFVANAATNLSGRPVLPQPEALALQAVVAENSGGGSPRVQNEHLIPEDYGMLARVEDVNGTSPLRLAHYDALLGDFPQVRLWQLTGVQYVLTSRDDLYSPSQVVAELPGSAGTGTDAAAAATADPSLIHQLTESHPRAWIVNSLSTADDASAPARLSDGNLDLAQTALLPPAVNGVGRPIGLEDGVLVNAGASEARVEQVAPGHLRIRVKSENGGYLVVSENWLPGWQAEVREGAPSAPAPSTQGALPVKAPVLRTNLAFLGLPIAAGEKTVELRYRPASVWGGLLISGLTILLLAGTLVVRRARANLLGHDANLPGHHVNLPGLRDLGGFAGGLAALTAVLLAFALRTFRLGYQELRGDEALGRLFSMESLPALLRQTIELAEPHPVASYAIQGAWLKLAGHTEFALRFVSAWFGVLAVALIYRLARRLGLDRGVAVLAAGLLAISPYAIWHSQDARMYSISLALTLASTVLMLEALARVQSVGATGRSPLRAGPAGFWAAYVVVTWLALQTHYYAAYIIVVQNLFVFGRGIANRGERRLLPQWVAAQAVTFILYLPWLIAARSTLTGYVGNGDSPGFVSMWLRSLGVFAVGETMPAGQRAAAGVLIALLALIGALRLSKSAAGRRALWLLAPYLAVPLLITWAGALSRPIFNERYIIAALPGLLLMVAGAASPPRERQAADAASGSALQDHLPVNGQATEQRPLKRAFMGRPRPKSPVYGALLRSSDIYVRAGSRAHTDVDPDATSVSASRAHTDVDSDATSISASRAHADTDPDATPVSASRAPADASAPATSSAAPAPTPHAPPLVTFLAASLLAVLLVATLTSLVHYYDDPAYSKSRGWRQLAAVLDRHSRSWPRAEVRVAQTYPDPTLWYYVTGDAEHLVLPPAANDESGARELVNQLAGQGVQRVVVAIQPSEGWDGREIAPRTLAEIYRLVSETPVGDGRVQVYDRPPAALPAAGVAFAGGLELAGAAVPGEQLSPGDVVPVYLQWRGGEQGLSGNEKITLQLLDAGSKVVAQIDRPFGQADLEAEPAIYALSLPRTLPAGSYRLIVALYDPSLGGSPRLLTLAGQDHVVLKAVGD